MAKFKDVFQGIGVFSGTFQCKVNFQGLFKTVLYIQVLFEPVRTLYILFQNRSGSSELGTVKYYEALVFVIVNKFNRHTLFRFILLYFRITHQILITI